ncbi:uncharacterized protein [Elaeis guineensis]|uniref:Uncharacterized protein LOC105036183 n=1 Tax=Elaeis guineensis var. tenera TaxID=51953 RepID=A0A6I9QLF9_ELAGV|nr:uncharacterized protein LOC105036183 [Elaeis guineensis]
MVARMMWWRPWPPLMTKKFQVRLVVRLMEGLVGVEGEEAVERVTTEVRWKGPKAALSSLRRTVKRNCTREEEVRDGTVEWNEEFESVCTLTAHRENSFHPWEIAFAVFNGLNQGLKNKASILGMASLNLAEFTSSAEQEIELNLPLLLPAVAMESPPSLHLVLSVLELRTSQESPEMVQRPMVPALLSPSRGDALSLEKDELSALKAGLRKVKILTEFVSTRKSKKTNRDDEGSDGKCSAKSDDAEYTHPFDTDSVDDDFDEGELEDDKADSSIRKSFSYGTLASANYVGSSLYLDVRTDREYEDWVYYSHRRSDVGYSPAGEMTSSVPEQFMLQASNWSILPWKRRKLSFKSPKAKGEPLLKKTYGEEGGDDIDYDRRLMSSSDESPSEGRQKVDEYGVMRSSVSEFGDDNFVVGNWESRDLVSRDGHMKLSTQVFFASIDQRSERASGESACTALVAVIADWFQTNWDAMPIRSQFDHLIREGSTEWRNLCENQTYQERFPDKHFDLETVIQAKIRPLSVVPRKSFIGFFHPDGTDDTSGFDFLHGAMSFDSIWDEISQAGSNFPTDGGPHLYIVSWNDHFFLLKVEHDAYYIIDTLGERLYEGCDQAYILKFDGSTTIRKIPGEKKTADSEAAGAVNGGVDGSTGENHSGNGDPEGELVCTGKESCKEYIKSFLAAIPIRELQADIKKGLMSSTPLHHRLQIEFHYTEASKEVSAAALPLAAAEAVPEFSWPLEPVAAFNPTPAVVIV